MADPMKKAAENVWRMLDQMAEKSPDEYKAFVNQQLKEGSEIFTPPQPAFCLCCGLKKAGSQKHIFINVCKWDRVPKPKTDSDPVAVKGGVLRHPTEAGKKMATDLLIDIAFHTSVVEECERDPDLQAMLRDLILDFVADFASVELDRSSCTRLDVPHRGSKEDLWYSLDEQWREMLSEETRMDVRHTVLSHLKQAKVGEKDKKTTDLPRLIPQSQQKASGQRLIEEIKGRSGDAQPKSIPPSTPKEILEHSVYVTAPTTSSGCPQKVKVKVKLLDVRSAAEIDLVVFEDHIQLGAPSLHPQDVQLPVPVQKDKAKAAYNPVTKTLSVSIPCL